MTEEVKIEDNPKNLTIDLDKARNELWARGVLHWKLHKAQMDMYEAFHKTKSLTFVINCSRRLGKSYFLIILAFEYAYQHPGSKICYAAPSTKAVKGIIKPLINEILQDCPVWLQPKWRASEQKYVFPNSSEMVLAGTDNERAEALRGQHMHLGICDEAGSMANLKYVISDIMIPMTLTTNGRIVMASTPPTTPAHDFTDYAVEAKLNGTYIVKTIYDNPLVTKQKIEKYKKAAGGDSSPTWRREYLAEFLVEKEIAVLPEFTEEMSNKLTKEVERPLYFDAYVGLDVGFSDNTGVLFGYWDFLNAKLIIEDELLLSQMTTETLANNLKDKERILWGTKPPYMRVSDTDLIVITDLSRLHSITFQPTRKDNKEAAINNVRLLIEQEKVIIHPRCKQLLMQMRFAVWNKNKTDFIRTAKHGHFDLVSALIYMARNVHRQHNPYPEGLGLDINTMMIRPDAYRQNENAQQVKKLFNVKRNIFDKE